MISKNTFVTMIDTISEVKKARRCADVRYRASFLMKIQNQNCLQAVIISRI